MMLKNRLESAIEVKLLHARQKPEVRSDRTFIMKNVFCLNQQRFKIILVLCYLSLVPSPPTNLLIRDVQSRRFQITFSAPYNINGEMVGYKIRLLHHQDCLQLIIVSNNCFQCMVKNTIIQLLLWVFF